VLPFASQLQTLQLFDGIDQLALVPATACPLKVTLEERLFSAGKSKPGNGHQFAECRRAAVLTAALTLFSCQGTTWTMNRRTVTLACCATDFNVLPLGALIFLAVADPSRKSS